MRAGFPLRRAGFTLVEILLALTLSGLALLSAFLLLDSFIRSADSQLRATWDTIARARFEKFLAGTLEDAAWNGDLAWTPTGASQGTSGLDWVLTLRAPESMIRHGEDDRPVLPAVFEIGWRRDEGLVFRGRAEQEPDEGPDFRPLLEENPFAEAVFHEWKEDPGGFEEIRPPRSANQATPPLPHIIHLRAGDEDGEDFWIYLPVATASSKGPGGRPPSGGRREAAPRPGRGTPGAVPPTVTPGVPGTGS